ncbi:MAG: hypothetical protein WCR74_16760, partial [Betaproteobacteria bacterium]
MMGWDGVAGLLKDTAALPPSVSVWFCAKAGADNPIGTAKASTNGIRIFYLHSGRSTSQSLCFQGFMQA